MGFGSDAKGLIEGLIGLIVVFEVFHFTTGTAGGANPGGILSGIAGFISDAMAYPGLFAIGFVLLLAVRVIGAERVIGTFKWAGRGVKSRTFDRLWSTSMERVVLEQESIEDLTTKSKEITDLGRKWEGEKEALLKQPYVYERGPPPNRKDLDVTSTDPKVQKQIETWRNKVGKLVDLHQQCAALAGPAGGNGMLSLPVNDPTEAFKTYYKENVWPGIRGFQNADDIGGPFYELADTLGFDHERGTFPKEASRSQVLLDEIVKDPNYIRVNSTANARQVGINRVRVDYFAGQMSNYANSKPDASQDKLLENMMTEHPEWTRDLLFMQEAVQQENSTPKKYTYSVDGKTVNLELPKRFGKSTLTKAFSDSTYGKTVKAALNKNGDLSNLKGVCWVPEGQNWQKSSVLGQVWSRAKSKLFNPPDDSAAAKKRMQLLGGSSLDASGEAKNMNNASIEANMEQRGVGMNSSSFSEFETANFETTRV